MIFHFVKFRYTKTQQKSKYEICNNNNNDGKLSDSDIMGDFARLFRSDVNIVFIVFEAFTAIFVLENR